MFSTKSGIVDSVLRPSRCSLRLTLISKFFMSALFLTPATCPLLPLIRFRVAADLGCADGQVLKRLVGGIGGITTLYQCDSSQAMLDLCAEGEVNGVMAHKMLVDEENLPFEKESMDLIISNLNLHWTNDAPSALVQIRDSLRPDGLFMGSMFGGDTLIELRHAFTLAEMERDGGVSPHVSPLAGIEDAGNLLGRSGFSIPAVDTDKFTVQFPSAMDMMHTLQGMGENNAIAMRRPYVSRDTMLAAAAAYEAIYGDENGVVPATFQVIYLSGWAPHESQQQAKKRGSATVSLSEIGEVTVLGDSPPPGGPKSPTPGMDTSRGG